MSFVNCSLKTGKHLKQKFSTGSRPGIVWMKEYLSNFNSTPLTCDPVLFHGKYIPNIGKSNRIFPRKWREDKDFILTYLDSSVAKNFRHCCLFFQFWPSSRGKEESKLDQRC